MSSFGETIVEPISNEGAETQDTITDITATRATQIVSTTNNLFFIIYFPEQIPTIDKQYPATLAQLRTKRNRKSPPTPTSTVSYHMGHQCSNSSTPYIEAIR